MRAILWLCFIVFPLAGQNRIARLAYSVADTTQSQTIQAEAVYNWIINNIAYDTKQIKKGIHEYTPQQTLKRKKAVCYGYSELFYEMCKALEIEAYMINGYCKGFGYINQDHFTRSNHTWNIIYADLKWIYVDATWGAGGLYYDYSFYAKMMKKLGSQRILANKIKFKPEPTNDYFNATGEEMIKTHFPIDSKWQFKEHPVTYNHFVFNEDDTLRYVNYNRELKEVRHHTISNQQFKDALNSPRYNPFNRFDIAHAYYKMSGQITINKKASFDSTMLEPFTKNMQYCDSATRYIKEFKTVSRAIFKEKSRNRKTSYKLGSKGIAGLRKVPTNSKEAYHKELNKIKKTDRDLKKTKLTAQLDMEKLENNISIVVDSVESYDSLTYINYIQSLEDRINRAESRLDQLTKLENNLHATCNNITFQNDSILYNLRNAIETLENITKSIHTMDEHNVFVECVNLYNFYMNYDFYAKAKKEAKSQIAGQYNTIQGIYSSAIESYNAVINGYNSLAKLTGNNEPYTTKVNEIRKRIYDIHRIELRTISEMKSHNESWESLLQAQNDIMEGYGKKELNKVQAILEKYYNLIMARSTMNYNQDMALYTEIRNGASQNKKALRYAIREIGR
ncbi:MAG: hypothetical protein JXB49_22495 [Bacteroidales bacterium]|nr:hypothetical protein [Bacteroidales bacterium]